MWIIKLKFILQGITTFGILNEGQGVSQDIINNSDFALIIKMTGRAESLNASVAAGISIYEIRKKLLK